MRRVRGRRAVPRPLSTAVLGAAVIVAGTGLGGTPPAGPAGPEGAGGAADAGANGAGVDRGSTAVPAVPAVRPRGVPWPPTARCL